MNKSARKIAEMELELVGILARYGTTAQKARAVLAAGYRKRGPARRGPPRKMTDAMRIAVIKKEHLPQKIGDPPMYESIWRAAYDAWDSARGK